MLTGGHGLTHALGGTNFELRGPEFGLISPSVHWQWDAGQRPFLRVASKTHFFLGWWLILLEMKVQLLTLCPFQMEISFGAMFLKMVWDTDIYQTMLVLLTITGIYTITGEVAVTTRGLILTQTLSRVQGATEVSQSL